MLSSLVRSEYTNTKNRIYAYDVCENQAASSFLERVSNGQWAIVRKRRYSSLRLSETICPFLEWMGDERGTRSTAGHNIFPSLYSVHSAHQPSIIIVCVA